MEKFNLKMMVMGLVLCSMVACTGNTANKTADENGCCAEQNCCNTNSNKEMKYSKKYTNADFYKDGKFDQKVAIEAMKDMFKFYGVP